MITEIFGPRDFRLDTVQDFVIKLGIKPRLHILKKGIFSLNHVIFDRILNFFFCEQYLTRRSTFMIFFENFDFKVLCFLMMCPIFVCSVNNFGRPDNDL